MEKQNLFKTKQFKLDKRLAGFYCYVTNFKNKTKISDIPIGYTIGAAVGTRKNNLRARSRYEAIERYCLYTKEISGIQFECVSNTKKQYFPIKKCILYSPNQESKPDFPFLKRKSKEKIPWVKAKELNKTNIFLPYHYVFPQKRKNEINRVDTWSTSGGASHLSTVQAIINGVLELVERDTVMCSWISKSGISRIDINTINSKRLNKLIGLLKELEIIVFLFSAKNEFGITTIIAALDKKDENFLSFGSACKADIYIAVEKAIYEAIMIRNTQYQLIKHNLVKSSRGLLRHVAAPIIFGEKICLWLFDKNIKTEAINQIIGMQPKKDTEIVEIIKKNFRVFVFNYSDQKVSKKTKVVKCIAPQLHPLELSSNLNHGDLKRVRQFANKSKIKTNYFIHPFG